MRDRCFGGWIYSVSKKFAVAKFRLDCIRERGEQEWLEFLQTMRVHCWAAIAEKGHDGISYYDVADAARSFIRGRQHTSWQEEPEPAYIEDPVEYEDGEDPIRAEVVALSDDDPYRDTLAHEVIVMIADEVTVLHLADQITSQDLAVLQDTSIRVTNTYVELVLEDVQQQIRRK